MLANPKGVAIALVNEAIETPALIGDKTIKALSKPSLS